jgi:hypothetical protein
MPRYFKSLKRNEEGGTETPIAPSKLPRLPQSLGVPPLISFTNRPQQLSALGPNLAARMARRHYCPALSNDSRGQLRRTGETEVRLSSREIDV